MNISRSWLSEFVDLSGLSDHDFSELVTTRIAEVDGVETVAAPLAQGVVAEVISANPHPENSKLTVAEVNNGSETLSVVCGAPNCRAGMRSAYLAPGAEFFPGGSEQSALVETREVKGVSSQGVLVSEAELQLTADHSGVMEFGDKLKAGTSLAKLLGEPDLVLEIDNKSLTHRPDLWCHAGFARELSAVLGRPLLRNVDQWADDTSAGRALFEGLGEGDSGFRIEIETGSGCRRFSALEIAGVRTEASPLLIRRRLHAVGAGVRNLLVDLSNYVMHDIGQPNHAYDADALSGSTVMVRLAKTGEAFVGLDDVERKLDSNDIVITDAGGPVALGGVIGGKHSAVQDSTTRLLLESGNFDPVRIRKTSKRLSLRTDASNRFEKSQSAFSVPLAVHRFWEILSANQKDAHIVGSIAEAFVERPAAVSVPVTYGFIRERLGADVADERIAGILTGLRFGIESSGSNQPGQGKQPGPGKRLEVSVPYFRATRDVSIAEDLVEEVGRIHGYENIAEVAPLIESTAPESDIQRDVENTVRDRLVGDGFSEASNYSFMNEARARELGFSTDNCVELVNSVDAERGVLRTTLIPGMLEVVERNSRYFDSFSLFEIGRGYSKVGTREQPAKERRLLSLAVVSELDDSEAAARLSPPLSGGALFYSLRASLADTLRAATGYYPQFLEVKADAGAGNGAEQAPLAWMHPFRCARVAIRDVPVGVLAEVRPGVLEDTSQRVCIAEIDLGLALEMRMPVEGFSPVPKYPDSLFEMSVVMPKRTPYCELEQIVRANIAGDVLRRMEVVSVYQGKPLSEDEKSISVKLFLGSTERTLPPEELKSIQDGLMAAVDKSEFSLRS